MNRATLALLTILALLSSQRNPSNALHLAFAPKTTPPLPSTPEDGGYQDRGWWRDDCDIARVVAGSLDDTRICRYRSNHVDLGHFIGYGLCYLISHDGTNPSADVPAPLRTAREFRHFLNMTQRVPPNTNGLDYCFTVAPSDFVDAQDALIIDVTEGTVISDQAIDPTLTCGPQQWERVSNVGSVAWGLTGPTVKACTNAQLTSQFSTAGHTVTTTYTRDLGPCTPPPPINYQVPDFSGLQDLLNPPPAPPPQNQGCQFSQTVCDAYQNTFGRPPEQEGGEFWEEWLENEDHTEEDFQEHFQNGLRRYRL